MMCRKLVGMREFVVAELEQATCNFADVVGKGGFGKVYRGTYHHQPVAVKVLNTVIVDLQREMKS